jgi:flagellar M-ring protein FliF
MGVSALMVAALCAGMMWYAGRTDWRVLFSGLDGKDTQQVAQELAAAGIPYQMTEDGSGIEVGADEVDKARIEVATKGMPQSGRLGFELFDKPNWVGSEFDEKVNYQRAMEGELEHTIGTIAVVRSARVHLVMPKDSLFGEGERPAKASVVLQLRRSSILPEQVEAIRSLVAGAVENLSPEDVTLVDAGGRVNLNARGPGAVADDAEQSLENKLVAMLEPTAGSGNVRATVNVSYDDSRVEKTDDIYDPAQAATLTMHKSEQTVGQKARVSGVPGTASNTPAAVPPGSVAAGGATGGGSAAAAVAAAVPPLMQTANAAAPGAGATAAQSAAQREAGLPVYPQNGSQGGEETATDESDSYAVSRHQSHIEQGPGQIRRVTAAVVVNDRMSSEGAGKLEHVVWKPRSPEEMQRLQDLARAAVGFDATRGDEVVIENVSFSSNMPEIQGPPIQRLMDEASTLLNTQPGLLKTLSVVVLGLLLVMMVLKPMTRQMMTALKETPPLALSNGGRGGAESAGLGGARAYGGPMRFETSGRQTEARGVYEQVSEHIRKEPAQSTRLLESWISDSGEAD